MKERTQFRLCRSDQADTIYSPHRLLTPFRQVLVIAFLPWRRSKLTAALMNDSKRDGAHSHAMLLRLPAQIEIVEMKVESLVKPDAMLFECGFPDGKQDAIHELAFLPRRTIGGQLTWKTSAMAD